jgi:hypothetical protein
MSQPSRKSFLSKLFSPRTQDSPKPKSTSVRTSFQAVAIQRGPKGCCQKAQQLGQVRFLAKHAPVLPLMGCSMQGECQCRYVKHSDRRIDSRRLMDVGMSTVLFDTQERRLRKGRRTADKL